MPDFKKLPTVNATAVALVDHAHPGVSPASAPALWLDASQIGGLADGAAVTTWPDLSGYARHATQATAGAKPTYKTAILNGRPVVRFDGTADHLDVAFSAGLNAATYTVLMVATLSGGVGSGTYRSPLTNRATVPGTQGFILYADNADAWALWQGDGSGSFQQRAGGTALVGSYVLCASYDGVKMDLRVNGSSVSSGAPGGAYVANATSPLRIGAGLSETTPGLFWNGDIAEVLIWGRALSTVERQEVDTYLGFKYGITVASAHTFPVAGFASLAKWGTD